MVSFEKFLALYKEYEQLVRANNKDVKVLEDELDNAGDFTGNRLRMCRQFRNYLVHTPDPGFIEVSDKMYKFLSGYVAGMKSCGDVAKKHMKKADMCVVSIKGHMSDALAVFNRYKQFDVVVDMGDGSYGALSVFDSVGVQSRAKLETLRIRKEKPVFCGPLDDFSSLDPDKITLCTDDGTSKGKLLGQIMFY